MTTTTESGISRLRCVSGTKQMSMSVAKKSDSRASGALIPPFILVKLQTFKNKHLGAENLSAELTK